MTSIIKVDQIQNAAGGTPTAADLGLNISGSVIQTQQFTYTGSTSWSSVGEVPILSGTVTPKLADSKFLMTVMMRASHDNAWSLYFVVGINGNKDLWSRGASYPAATGSLYRDQSAVNSQASIDEYNGQYLYSHSGSTDVNVTVYGRGQGGTNYMNYAYAYNDVSRGRPLSILTVQEIAG